MEISPLTQQSRPSSFQPKIDSLYEELFRADAEESALSDGFWREFFILKPNRANLRRRLDSLSADDLLQLQNETQQLFRKAVGQISSDNGVSDEAALDTLTVFLGVVLAKRYTNPSSEIITVLAGLDEVDVVFSDFASTIESAIRSGSLVETRQKAIQVAISITAGAYQTSLVSYFTHRDLFPCLVKYIQDVDTPILVFEPFSLLGLLANYNKFEFRNPYRLRLEDFVNDTTIQKIVQGLGAVCARSRDQYVAIQDDVQEGWTLSSTLKYIGLGILAPGRPTTPTSSIAEDGKDPFATLPNTDATILLAAYDFTNANKLFCFNLVTRPAPNNSKKDETPFGAFLSLTSYILHHAHRSSRASLYAILNLTTLRILIEDQALCAKLFDPSITVPVRLCRQRAPFLPSTSAARPTASAILDIAVDTITHNLRRRLDIPLYIFTIAVLHRLLSYLATTRTRYQYHWPLLWQTLLSLLRFLTTYASSLVSDPTLPALLDPFLATLALALTAGDSFLLSPSDHDDLFYKLVEAAHILPKFKAAFSSLAHTAAPATPNPSTVASPTALIDLLIDIAKHFQDLLDEERNGRNLSPREVGKVIRKGYETLRVKEVEGLERWVRWREGEERGSLKRVARCVVDDAKKMVGGGQIS